MINLIIRTHERVNGVTQTCIPLRRRVLCNSRDLGETMRRIHCESQVSNNGFVRLIARLRQHVSPSVLSRGRRCLFDCLQLLAL